MHYNENYSSAVEENSNVYNVLATSWTTGW